MGQFKTGSLPGQSFTHDFRLSVDLHNPQCEHPIILIWAQASSRGRNLSWKEHQQQLSVMFSLSEKFSKLPYSSTSVPVRFPGWSTKVTSWDINCLRHTCQVFYIGSTNSGDGEFQKESKKTKRWKDLVSTVLRLPPSKMLGIVSFFAQFMGFVL